MIYIVGLGPGGEDEITPRAMRALERSDVIIGYESYVGLLAPIFGHKTLLPFAMKQEVDRCGQAAELARYKTVALVSSGDAGVYGMAGLMLEVLDARHENVEVEVVPGVTAACSAAAVLGAPLAHDFAVVSLSDLLTPWSAIEKRLTLATEADFILCLYNPASRSRSHHLRQACEAIMKGRDGGTPSGWVRNIGRERQTHKILTLSELREEKLDMLCTVIVGNSETKILGRRMVAPWVYNIEGDKRHEGS
ncbi:MAG: precorrin-3B C(17)-methyltransferase [Synergistaceae bacterium]|jgi:precorrin-3B C17-methyltransferase|nr:precorrin-3B C(17)-methyltransferase [Synergistaceae bacterium]